MADFSKLRDDQIEPPTANRLPADVRIPDDEPVKFIRRIKGMLVGDDYQYAEYTLRGILDTIEKTGRVTEGQSRAILNIENNPNTGGSWRAEKKYKRRWTR